MRILNSKHDIGRLYAECILYWMLDNVIEGQPLDDYQMRVGSGLPDFEFKLGMAWLVQHDLLDQNEQENFIH